MTAEVPRGWVQVERAAHDAWAGLIARNPQAARLLHALAARVGEHNAVVVSQKTLQDLLGVSRPTIQRALKVLAEERWIEVVRIGERGTVNAHILNDRVVWSGPREKLRYSTFSATVIASASEQPDGAQGEGGALRRVPALTAGGLPAAPEE